MTLDPHATDTALASGVTARSVDRDVIWVDGPDARSYLQGQITQDVDPLSPGGATEALVLSPQGKIDGYVRVIMVGDERFAVEVEAGFGEEVLERLRRFKIRIKATLELASVPVVEVRGPRAVPPVEVPPGVMVLPFRFGDLVGYDLFGAGVAIPDGIEAGDPQAFERARIAAGLPRMGRELTEKTIPAEAALVERTVSFTKGCYTGQELVARLDARGNRVPWNIVAVAVDRPLELAAGERLALTVDGDEVGYLTSVEPLGDRASSVALGFVKRSFEIPGQAEVATTSGIAAATITSPPAQAS